jgi:hypothetical protein
MPSDSTAAIAAHLHDLRVICFPPVRVSERTAQLFSRNWTSYSIFFLRVRSQRYWPEAGLFGHDA